MEGQGKAVKAQGKAVERRWKVSQQLSSLSRSQHREHAARGGARHAVLHTLTGLLPHREAVASLAVLVHRRRRRALPRAELGGLVRAGRGGRRAAEPGGSARRC